MPTSTPKITQRQIYCAHAEAGSTINELLCVFSFPESKGEEEENEKGYDVWRGVTRRVNICVRMLV